MNVGFSGGEDQHNLIYESDGSDFRAVAKENKSQGFVEGSTRRVIGSCTAEASKLGFFRRLIEWFIPSKSQKDENRDMMSTFKSYLINEYGQELTQKLCPKIDKHIESSKPLSARTIAEVLDKGDELKQAQRLSSAAQYADQVRTTPEKFLPMENDYAGRLTNILKNQSASERISLKNCVKHALAQAEHPLSESRKLEISQREMLSQMFLHGKVFTQFTAGILDPNVVNQVTKLDLEDKQKLGAAIADAILEKAAKENRPVSKNEVDQIIRDLSEEALKANENKSLAKVYGSQEKISEILGDNKPRKSEEYGLQFAYNLMKEPQKNQLSNSIFEAIHRMDRKPTEEECRQIVLDQSRLVAEQSKLLK